MSDVAPKLLRAKYAFKATNNDELDFLKGDIITLTQCIDGGWWEGTLNGKTGWFPGNYVMEYKADDRTQSKLLVTPVASTTAVPAKSSECKKEHHGMVTRSFVDTETSYVNELQSFVQTYLRPLNNANILNPSEYAALCGNIEEIMTFHQTFLTFLVDCAKLPVLQQRLGGIFMKHAPRLKSAYTMYAANHPRAVTMLAKYKDELNKFMESKGASPPGAMALTSHLSIPFQRLDKYPSLLKELERHIDDAHVDRGDTQRAIAVYREIQVSCTETRKDKEMENEILTSPIKNWEGEDIHGLGEVQLAANVHLHAAESTGAGGTSAGSNGGGGAAGGKDRICVLFPSTIVMISVTATLTYQYEGKILTTGVSVKKLEDCDKWTNALEISGNMIDTIVFSFTTPQKQLKWYDRLMQLDRKSPVPSKMVGVAPVATTSTPTAVLLSSTTVTAVPAAAASLPKVSVVSSQSRGHAAVLPPLQSQPPKGLHQQQQQSTQPPSPLFYLQAQPLQRQLRAWAGFCLRPLPPARPTLTSRDDVGNGRSSPKLGRKPSTLGRRKTNARVQSEASFLYRKIDDTKTLQKDSHILRVIEAYCTSTKTRHTVNSSVMDSPNMLIAEEEKIICEEIKGDQTIVEEKSLVDTVYAIKDKLKELQLETSLLRKDLDEERRARKKLEACMSNHVKTSGGSAQLSQVTCRQSSVESAALNDKC